MNWIRKNRKWVFSGIGVAVLTIAIKILLPDSSQQSEQKINVQNNSQSPITGNIENQSNEYNNAKTSNDDNSTNETVNVTSNNQKGGITANTVIINQEKPKPPVENEVIRILNDINTEIIVEFQGGRNPICIMVNQIHENQLMEIRNELEQKKILSLKSTNSSMGNNTNQMGDCINDTHDGWLNGYSAFFMKNFTKVLSKAQ